MHHGLRGDGRPCLVVRQTREIQRDTERDTTRDTEREQEREMDGGREK